MRMMWKKLPFLIWKNVEKSVITLFSSLTLKKKIKTIFLTNHMSKHKTTGGWSEACRQVRISLNIVLDQEKTKQKYKINTYCVQLYSFWCIRHLGICKPSCIWILLFEYYFKWKKVLKNNEKKICTTIPPTFENPPIKNTFLLYLSL